ncbi:cleavage and polyadenylation specificity factor subunit 7-like isoform X3 [Leuresthes tenuis]|uniref:cleavage and polyadenylation specificity factor subunit 7-like isoform X3 n=1 Tax=Leuresthes tenuis TaxID=355514 RepID=UPI003B50B22B
MAAAPSAAGSSASKNNPIDLYSDLNPNDEDLEKIAEANELFDAVLTGSVNQEKTSTCNEVPAKEDNKSIDEKTQKGGNALKRLSLYIGNFPWWTSDKDLTSMAQRLGVKDIVEVRFAENRVNGQSRGFAEVVVTSEESFKVLLEKIPQCHINGERIDCRFATRQNLTVFEDIANKRIPLRVNSGAKESDSAENIPTSLSSQESSLPPIPPLFPSHPLANSFPTSPSPFLIQPPPLFPHMPPVIPPLMPSHFFPPPPVHVSGQPSPSLHINPAFFTAKQDGQSGTTYGHQKQSTDGDFEELMNRNKTIASSAITKAVSGATAVAVVLEKKKGTGTEVVRGSGSATESESATENVIETGTGMTLMAGKVRECLEDTENVPGVERGTRSARGNENGTENTETDTANLPGGDFVKKGKGAFCFCTSMY